MLVTNQATECENKIRLKKLTTANKTSRKWMDSPSSNSDWSIIATGDFVPLAVSNNCTDAIFGYQTEGSNLRVNNQRMNQWGSNSTKVRNSSKVEVVNYTLIAVNNEVGLQFTAGKNPLFFFCEANCVFYSPESSVRRFATSLRNESSPMMMQRQLEWALRLLLLAGHSVEGHLRPVRSKLSCSFLT